MCSYTYLSSVGQARKAFFREGGVVDGLVAENSFDLILNLQNSSIFLAHA